MKQFLSLSLAAIGVTLGVFTIYEVLAQFFPATGLVPELLVSLAIASFMIAAGGAEIGRWMITHFKSGGNTKRCRSCKAMVPVIARYCRECGTAF